MTNEREMYEAQWGRARVEEQPERRRLPGEREERPPRGPEDDRTEADLVGTWFARIGALAILIGAGFGFKEAIDRGWIGPELRVVLGMVAGIAFLGWGEWAAKRGWAALAQAVSAGGIGLLYLSVLAGFHLYGIFEPGVAFGLLTLVAVTAVSLAIRHDSQPVAVLAAIGAFVNPFMIGIEAVAPEALLGYVLVVDVGVLALAAFRRWPGLDAVALTATWAIAAIAMLDAPVAAVLGFGAAYVAVFNARTLLHAAREGVATEDLTFVLPSTIIYLGLGIVALDGPLEVWEGRFTIALALGHLLMAFLALQASREPLLSYTHFGLAAALAAIAVPIALEGPVIGVAWTGEALVLLGVGRLVDSRGARAAGAVLLAWAVAFTFGVELEGGLSYRPERFLVSGVSAVLVLQVVALAVAAFTLGDDPDDWEGVARNAFMGTAHLLAIAWMLLEAKAGFLRLAPEAVGARQFAYTAILSVYGAALMAAGVALRMRAARLFALWLLVVAIVKLVVIDVWMMELVYRMIAFVGLGALLLALSVMYQRLRELVTGDAR